MKKASDILKDLPDGSEFVGEGGAKCHECKHSDMWGSDWHCCYPRKPNTPQVLTPFVTPEWCPLNKD